MLARAETGEPPTRSEIKEAIAESRAAMPAGPAPTEKKPPRAKRGRAKKAAGAKTRRKPKPPPELEPKVVQAISVVKGVLKPFSPSDRKTICDRAITDFKKK